MKSFTVEVTKIIVVTVEADDFETAVILIEKGIAAGEHSYSFDKAEPQFLLLDEAEKVCLHCFRDLEDFIELQTGLCTSDDCLRHDKLIYERTTT